MTEESTPLENAQDVTSENTDAVTVESANTPAEVNNEPSNAEVKADEAEQKEASADEPKLYAGKYKSIEELEKGYKEAEKFVAKANEYEKQLKAYQDKEQQAANERQEQAVNAGFDNETQQRLVYEIKNHEFNRYAEALQTTLSGDAYVKAQNALLKYQQTGNAADLEQAKAYFSPQVIELIARDTAKFEQQKNEQYQEYQAEQSWRNKKAALEKFAQDTGDWLNPKERQEIVGLAVNITDGNIDLGKVKELVDACEKQAVERYIAEQKAIAENKAAQDSLTAPVDGPNNKKEHIYTLEEINNMSQEEYDASYEDIAKQVMLERDGKLPRRLI